MIKYVTKRSGQLEKVDLDKINLCVQKACNGVEDVAVSAVVLGAKLNLYEGITTVDIDRAMILSARSLIETEPNYSFVAAKLLLNTIYKEVFGISTNADNFDTLYRAWFIESIEDLIREKILDHRLPILFDLEDLADCLVPERDHLFRYLGLQTLVDRYLKRDRQGKLCQTPQMFHMVVAMGLSLNENAYQRQALCRSLYESMSKHEFSPSTPTLFNAGTSHSQLSSCYLSSMGDSLDGIMGEMHSQARLSKFAGGLGVDITNVRGAKSPIKSTNGKSSGVIPYAALFDRLLLAFNQAGRRFGSGCLYLEPWHIDILDFLQLRKTTGDERRRTRNTNTAIWINDLLMEYKKTDRDWYLFSPDECPNLHSTYGAEFKKEYEACVDRAKRGLVKNFKVISSKKLVKEMYTQYCETGHPFHCFKDSSNIRYMNKHAGIINSSNLCCIAGDQLIPTEKGLCYAKDLAEDGSNNIVVGRNKLETSGPMKLINKDAEMLKITLSSGYTHKVTPDHPIWIYKEGWKQAKDLEIKDRIELQSVPGPWGKHSDKDLALLCGFLCIQNKVPGNTRFEFPSDKAYAVPIIEETLKKYFKDLKFSAVADKLVIASHVISEIFDSFIFRDGKIIVPDFILKSDKETVIEFLKGIFIANSYPCETGKIKNYKPAIEHTSKGFLDVLQILMSNFVIHTDVKYIKKIKNDPLFRLGVCSFSGTNKLISAIKYFEITKDDSYPTRETSQDTCFATVVKKEVVPNEDSYCLTVNSSEHSWVANGIVTKNTEILEHTKPSIYNDIGIKTVIGETAVCTLNSANLVAHAIPSTEGALKYKIDMDKLKKTTKLQVRCLDNAIDNNFYPILEAENSAKLNRQIGIGIMGFQEYLQMNGIAYSDPRVQDIAGEISEWIALCAIEESIELAKERGVYPNYPGSEWSKGKLPQDLYEEHYKYRFDTPAIYKTRYASQWEEVRKALWAYGIRNGNLMAIAPTATISYILGVSQSIEPDYSLLYTYETLSGKFTMINHLFVEEMKRRGLWGHELIEALKNTDGDIKFIEGIPEELKTVYCTAFDQDMFALMRCAAERNIWIDQGQSFNIYYEGKSLKHIDDLITYSHNLLMKTNYYMRSRSASKIEKSTSRVVAVPATTPLPEISSCSIEAMQRGEVCESCQ